MSKFFEYAQTDIICRREVTEGGKERVKRIKAWLREVLDRPEVLGVVGWIQRDYEDPTWEKPMFNIYVKKGMLPVVDDDPFEVSWYYSHEGVENKCPGMVWLVEEVDELPEFDEGDETFTVWMKGDAI